MSRRIWMTTIAVLALGATMAVAADAAARGHGLGMSRRGAIRARLAQALDLSDAQKQQIREQRASLREQRRALVDSVRQDMSDLRTARQAGDEAKVTALRASLQARHAEFMAFRQAQRERFESILTAGQRAKLDQIKAEHQARQDRRRNG